MEFQKGIGLFHRCTGSQGATYKLTHDSGLQLGELVQGSAWNLSAATAEQTHRHPYHRFLADEPRGQRASPLPLSSLEICAMLLSLLDELSEAAEIQKVSLDVQPDEAVVDMVELAEDAS